MRARIVGLVIPFVVLAGAAQAAPLQRADVPEPLRPWVDWVLRGHEDAPAPRSSATPSGGSAPGRRA